MAIEYRLYRAVDNRDGKEHLWMLRVAFPSLALFDAKTSPSRIKHRSLAQPSSITWESEYAWITHVDYDEATLVDTWKIDE